MHRRIGDVTGDVTDVTLTAVYTLVCACHENVTRYHENRDATRCLNNNMDANVDISQMYQPVKYHAHGDVTEHTRCHIGDWFNIICRSLPSMRYCTH